MIELCCENLSVWCDDCAYDSDDSQIRVMSESLI